MSSERCQNCGAPEGEIRGIFVCGSDKHQGGHRSTACDYAAELRLKGRGLEGRIQFVTERAERAEAERDDWWQRRDDSWAAKNKAEAENERLRAALERAEKLVREISGESFRNEQAWVILREALEEA